MTKSATIKSSGIFQKKGPPGVHQKLRKISIQKNGKFQWGHGKFDWKSKERGGGLASKNRYPQQLETIFFLGKPNHKNKHTKATFKRHF